VKAKGTYGHGTVRLIKDDTYEMKYRPAWAAKPLYERIKVDGATEKIRDKKAKDTLTFWRTDLDKRNKAPVALSVEQLHDLLISDMRRKKCSPENIVHVSNRFNKNIRGYFKQRDMIALGKKDIRKYIDHRLDDEAEVSTINRELSAIGRSLRLAQDEDPLCLVPPIEKLPNEKVRCGFVEHEQYMTLLRAIAERSRMLWCFGYHWGVRRGEFLKLRWDWMLPYWAEEEPIIKIPGFDKTGSRITKNGKPHTLPIYSDEMRAFIEMAMATRNPKCPYLFQDEGERLTVSKAREDFEQARRSVGMDGIIFHDLRRSAVRLMKRAGVPDAEVMQITGHRTHSILKRYDIAAEAGAQETGRTMRSFMQTENQKLVGKLVGRDFEEAQKGSEPATSKLLN
jgi:integrase